MPPDARALSPTDQARRAVLATERLLRDLSITTANSAWEAASMAVRHGVGASLREDADLVLRALVAAGAPSGSRPSSSPAARIAWDGPLIRLMDGAGVDARVLVVPGEAIEGGVERYPGLALQCLLPEVGWAPALPTDFSPASYAAALAASGRML